MSCDMNESNRNVVKFYMNINIAHIIRIAQNHAAIVIAAAAANFIKHTARDNNPQQKPPSQQAVCTNKRHTSHVTRHTHNAAKIPNPKVTHDSSRDVRHLSAAGTSRGRTGTSLLFTGT